MPQYRPKYAANTAAIMQVDGLTIQVTRKPIKNLYLRIKPPDGSIEISAPLRVNDRQIREFVSGRTRWILSQRQRMAEARGNPGSSLNAAGSGFAWTPATKAKAERMIMQRMPGLLSKWEPVIGRKPSHITLRVMSSRWGSCTPKTRRIRLNLQLGLMEGSFLEYVLVHEMTHLWANGHGSEFQRRMNAYLPGWRTIRRELNKQVVW